MRFGTSVCHKNSILKSKIEHSLSFFFEQFDTPKIKIFSATIPTSATTTNTTINTITAEAINTTPPQQLHKKMIKQVINCLSTKSTTTATEQLENQPSPQQKTTRKKAKIRTSNNIKHAFFD